MSTPTISSISPNSGPIIGGQTATISGTNLADVTNVTIGTSAATNLTVASSGTQITCITWAGAAADTYDVVSIAGNYGTTWSDLTEYPNPWFGIAMSSARVK